MRFLSHTLPTLSENLALDEALLLLAEEGASGEVLRLWEWTSAAVVLGAAGQVAVDVEVERCRRDGVEIRRRSSGGGTVLLGPGCLMYSLILSYERADPLKTIHGSYRWILGRMSAALASLGSVEPAGICDLAIGDRKFSGNAQQRKRSFLLHHGTLLYNFPLESIPRYLRQPNDMPEYRANRPHTDFVMNLPTDGPTLERLLREAWQPDADGIELPMDRVRILLEDRYLREDWVFRR